MRTSEIALWQILSKRNTFSYSLISLFNFFQNSSLFIRRADFFFFPTFQ